MDDFHQILADGKVTITPAFQYGQKDGSGSNRWVVYHDQDNKPNQHRFIAGLAQTLGDAGADLLKKMGISSAEELKAIMDGVSKYFGNKLHTFEKK